MAETVDQLVIERVFAGENAPVRDRVPQHIRRHIAFLRHDPEKLIVSLHDETLDVIAFLRRDRPRAVEHVLELAAFEDHRGEPDFIEELLVVQRLNDDTDAAGDRRFVRHQIFSAAGDVVAARGRERIHVNHHRFLRPRFHHPVVDDIRGGDLAAGRIDLEHDRAHVVVVARLLQGGPHVVHH